MWKVHPSNMKTYNDTSTNDTTKLRPVLDSSATNFLNGSWNDTYFMSPNIQGEVFNPLLPSAQFPRDVYDGNFVVPQESKRWMNKTMPHSGLALFWANHTGITMEGYQLMDVRAFLNVWSCSSLHHLAG
jgi:hypothetical protein